MLYYMYSIKLDCVVSILKINDIKKKKKQVMIHDDEEDTYVVYDS